MNFALLKSITIPEGVVTQITDSLGRVIWKLKNEESGVMLEVTKVTSNTYANSTAYSNEEFVLLDIYPKTNGVVTVTYGNVVRTITDTSGAEEPEAQQVVFGTFNGVTHDTESPFSGILLIEGDCQGFGVAKYNSAKSQIARCSCINAVRSLGAVPVLSNYAFYECSNIDNVIIPNSVTSIGHYSFYRCSSLNAITIPDSVTFIDHNAFNACSALSVVKTPKDIAIISSQAFANCSSLASFVIPDTVETIDTFAFSSCTSLTSIVIPSRVTLINPYAFQGCTALEEVIFENPDGWYMTSTLDEVGTIASTVAPRTMANDLSETFPSYYYYRNVN